MNINRKLLLTIKLDASSREAGALKGEVVVYYFEPLITLHMGASGTPRFQ
jgi:hypothetical protein